MCFPTLTLLRQRNVSVRLTLLSQRFGGTTHPPTQTTTTGMLCTITSQNIWYYGNLTRTAWVDRGVNETPIAAGRDGYLYNHEVGFDDGSTNPASPIVAYIESSQFDIGDGDQFSFVRRLIPDLTFRNSTAETPIANFTVKARNFPGGAYLQDNSKAVEKTASVPVEQFTQDAHIRLRGRSIAIKVDSDATGTGWRLGSPRIDVRSDGRR